MALGLGLAAVTAGLIPWADETSALLPTRGCRVAVQSLPALESPRLAAHDGESTWVTPGERPHAPHAAVVSPGSVGGPWTPTASLHTAATLWEFLRVSAPRDQRAFLLTTAFQLHTPAAVPAGTPQRVFPSKEG